MAASTFIPADDDVDAAYDVDADDNLTGMWSMKHEWLITMSFADKFVNSYYHFNDIVLM